MTSILSGSLAATITGALSDLFLDATLTRETTPPTSPAFDPFDPPAPTLVNYACKAIRDNYSRYERSDGSILQGDAKLLVLVNTLSVEPMKNDILTIQGSSFTIIEFTADPANACWTIQGRK